MESEHVEIKATGLNVWYKKIHALKDVSAEIYKNKVTALIGASGSGKTTFLRALNRMHDTIPAARVEGSISFNGQGVLDKHIDVIELRRKVGMVFQNPTPFPKSIYDNIAYGLEIQGWKNKRKRSALSFFGNKKIKSEEIEKSNDPIDLSVVKSLKEAALWDEVKDRLHHTAFGLSGGQQQRLCIARAIAIRPQVLLLDEPCSELDPISTRKIEDLLLKLRENYTIVIVTHNMHQARRVADYVGFFHLSELVEFGTAKDIFESPKKELTKDYIRGDFG
jgi:phosphate transport system ATP-binding protein